MKFINNPIFKSMVESVEIICKQNNVDDTHGLAHSLKIAELTQRALLTQPLQYDGIAYSNIMYAALLHDIDDRKYFKTSKNCCNARSILSAYGITGERQEDIISMIDSVSFSKHGNNIDSNLPYHHYIPRYIDRSEAIGMEGLYRTLQYSLNRSKENAIIFNESTPRPLSVGQLYQISNGRDQIYKKNGGYSASVIDHFFDKLVHIKLPSAIKTPFLIELYNQKHSEMVQFVLKHAKDSYSNFRSDLEQFYQKQHKI